MGKKEDFFSMLDGEFAEGAELLNMMQLSVIDPETTLTERERCRVFMARYLFAAAVESCNRATAQFPVSPAEVMADFWLMAGEAVACVTVQAFDSAPRSRRAVRNKAKELIMQGYDHAMKLVDQHDGRKGMTEKNNTPVDHVEPAQIATTAALKLAIEHIEHMAAFITKQNAGYSFESLGEDMPGLKAALGGAPPVDFPYQRTFNATAASVKLGARGITSIHISVKDFQNAWNATATEKRT